MDKAERDLLDQVAAAVFVLEVDPTGVPVYAAFNRFAIEASGLSIDDVIGKTAIDVYGGRAGEAAFERHLQVCNSGATMTYEVTLPLQGAETVVRTTLIPRLDENGKLTRLVGTSIDLSEERRYERDALKAQADAEGVLTEMEQFVAIAAHDLRTPMRHVRLLAAELREGFGDGDPDKLELIDMIEAVGVKSTAMVTDLLSYSRATSADPVLRKFNLHEACMDIIGVIDPMAKHDISFPSVEIEAEYVSLQIILRNLIDNSIKHAERDRLAIVVSLSQGDNNMLEITVSDNGNGFDNPTIAFLDSGSFDSGFGLLGIRRLIRSRGGSISAIPPTDGQGAFVEFTFPGQILNTDVTLA